MTILSRAVLTSILLVGLFHAEVQADDGLASPFDPVTITDVQVRISDHGAVVLLLAEGKAIPIFVDLTVALSIQGALNGEKLSRPLTHDLMHTILDAYGGKVLRTVITLKRGNYYCALTVVVEGQGEKVYKRASPLIAPSRSFNAPIILGRELL